MARTIETVAGEFNFHRAQKLRRRTRTAVKKEETEFQFEGEQWQIEFAKQMVTFLESQFDLKSEDT